MNLCENVKVDVIAITEDKITVNIKERDENVWYLDNGASNHMTGRHEKFEKLDRTVKGEVKFGDGSVVQIQGRGSIKFLCKNGETRILSEVYYIPTLRSNIISLGQLSEEGNRVVMNGEKLWVYDSCGRMLMQVQRSANRLYKIHIQEAEHYCLLTKGNEEAWLWHKRLGHVNFKAMQLLSKNHMAHGVPNIVHPKEICESCLMTKQTRRPFPNKSNFVAKSALELIHLDLCGPISPSTPGGTIILCFLLMTTAV